MCSREIVIAALAVAVPACGNVASPPGATCGAVPVEVLADGSFEAATSWTQAPPMSGLICDSSQIMPTDGSHVACLGGTDGTIKTLSQQVPLPSGAKTATLSGQICVDTAETQPVDHDTLDLDLVDDTMVVASFGQYTNQPDHSPCVFMAFQKTAAVTGAPATATLRIRSTLDANLPTSFYLDALSLTVSCQ